VIVQINDAQPTIFTAHPACKDLTHGDGLERFCKDPAEHRAPSGVVVLIGGRLR
jgi:hypothetical protein